MPKALKYILPPPAFPEFLNLMAREMKDIGLGEGLVEAFREFDKDHNGFVSVVEFRRTLADIGGKLTDDEVDEMIREVNFDVDGQINYEEFIKFMMSSGLQQQHLYGYEDPSKGFHDPSSENCNLQENHANGPSIKGETIKDKIASIHETSFFFQEDLHPGKLVNLPSLIATSDTTPFLSDRVAKSIPFSTHKLSEILDHFSLKPQTSEANTVNKTIRGCQRVAINGEQKFCATSLESFIDSSISILGKRIQLLSNELSKETKNPLFTITRGVQNMGENPVVCHKMEYPSAVFMCHSIDKTTVYKVPLVGRDGTKASALAVCHKDTSGWNSKHMAFEILRVKPGTVTVCHFLVRDTLIVFAWSHGAVPEEVYWKSVFPNNPMPKALKDILPPLVNSGDAYSDREIDIRYYVRMYTDTFKQLIAAIMPRRNHGDCDPRLYEHEYSRDRMTNRDRLRSQGKYGDGESNKLSETTFFLQRDLRIGKPVNLTSLVATSDKTAFLPDRVAKAIPFSSDKLSEILNNFSLKPQTREANLMDETIRGCELTENKSSVPHH
ncbi:hypothetical protein GQ457_01G038890 [Hibiscus cannabinus]